MRTTRLFLALALVGCVARDGRVDGDAVYDLADGEACTVLTERTLAPDEAMFGLLPDEVLDDLGRAVSGATAFVPTPVEGDGASGLRLEEDLVVSFVAAGPAVHQVREAAHDRASCVEGDVAVVPVEIAFEGIHLSSADPLPGAVLWTGEGPDRTWYTVTGPVEPGPAIEDLAQTLLDRATAQPEVFPEACRGVSAADVDYTVVRRGDVGTPASAPGLAIGMAYRCFSSTLATEVAP